MFCIKINHDDSKIPFESCHLPDDPRAFIHSCYSLIGCNCIDVVPTVISGLVLVVDDCAMCFEGWESRFNNVASIFYGLRSRGFIIGDVVLARRDGENLVSLTSDDVAFLKRHFPDCYFSA